MSVAASKHGESKNGKETRSWFHHAVFHTYFKLKIKNALVLLALRVTAAITTIAVFLVAPM